MSSLGDVIHTLPALSDAAAALPGIRFDWVVEEAFAEVPGWHPAVEQVVPIALRRWRKTPFTSFTGPEWRACRAALRRHHYDAVIDAQGLIKSALVTTLVKAPRYGLDRDSAREPLAARAYHHQIAVPKDLHAVERVRLLFARALGYEPPTTQGDYGLRQHLQPAGGEHPPSLLFFHGTARPEKLWPETHWIELADRFRADHTVWLPWGSEAERERAERIAGQAVNAQVLPRLDLRGLAGLLLEVKGAVAVDTGLGHLAAALDVPTVSLYGPTQVSRVGAYGRNQVHIQSGLGAGDTDDPLAMMSAIGVEPVERALRQLLSGGA